jgi:hypothetical protein
MIQKDYILRMTEQIAKILARILLNKQAGKQEEALREIENSLKVTIGIDPLLLETLSIDDVAELLGVSKDGSAGSVKCIFAGRLLKEKAELLAKIDEGRSKEYYHKALDLYLRGILSIGYTEMDLSGCYSEIKAIEMQLGELISKEEMQLLSGFYQRKQNPES